MVNYGELDSAEKVIVWWDTDARMADMCMEDLIATIGSSPSHFHLNILPHFSHYCFVSQGETNNTADINLSRLSELLARSFCVALTPHLSELYTTGHTHLGLRTTLHQDNVSQAAHSGRIQYWNVVLCGFIVLKFVLFLVFCTLCLFIGICKK